MKKLLQVLNRPEEAFKSENRGLSWLLVAVTILINSVFEPVLRLLADKLNKEIDISHMLILMIYGFASYILICFILWIVCKGFGSKAKPIKYINTWGLSFFPTLLCAIVVAVTETYFFIFWNSILWGIFFNILFGGILLWKAILYIIYLKEIAGLRKGKLVGAFIIIGMLIVGLAALNGYVGLKTPVI